MTTPKVTNSSEHRPFRGIALSVFGIGYITFNDSMMKLVVNDHPIGQAIFICGVFVLLLILCCSIGRRFAGVRIDSLRLQFWLAVLLVLPIFLFLYALVSCRCPSQPLSFSRTHYSLFVGTDLAGRTDYLAVVFARRLGIHRRGLVLNPTSSAFEWVLLAPLRWRYCRNQRTRTAPRDGAGPQSRCFARASSYDHRGLHVSARMGRNGPRGMAYWPCRNASLDWGFTA